MIVDTSALVAIVMREPEADDLIDTLTGGGRSGIGTPTLVELGIVLTARMGVDARPVVARLVHELALLEIPFGPAHWVEAVDAFRRYGRGRNKAGLNFGDCMTYAVARLAAEPLLYVGDDFTSTDLERVGA